MIAAFLTPACRCRTPLAVIALLALAACQRAGGDADYFPLAAGLGWQYRIVRTTMDGSREQRYALATVAPTAQDDGTLGIRESIDGQRYYYRRTDAGVMRVGTRRKRGDRMVEDAREEMVLPAHLDDSTTWKGATTTTVLESSKPPWENTFRVTVPVTMHYKVESTRAAVDTPAGHFDDCLLVSGAGKVAVDIGGNLGETEINVESREWYSPRVGLVRLERTEQTSAQALARGTLVMELDEFHDR